MRGTVDVSKQVLTPEHRSKGLQLWEDEDILTLMLHGTPQAAFGIHATIEEIRAEADRAMAGVQYARK